MGKLINTQGTSIYPFLLNCRLVYGLNAINSIRVKQSIFKGEEILYLTFTFFVIIILDFDWKGGRVFGKDFLSEFSEQNSRHQPNFIDGRRRRRRSHYIVLQVPTNNNNNFLALCIYS